MSGATANLPSLNAATDASLNVQSGLTGFLGVAESLVSTSADSPLHGITDALHGLEGMLQIDVTGLSQNLPKALTTIENALPADTLRFVEDLKNSYREVSDFLSNCELVRQVHPGASLEQVALALVDDVLKALQSRLAGLGPSLFDPDLIDQLQAANAIIEKLAAGSSVPPGEFLEFLSQNLMGIAPDLLRDAGTHLQSALGVLDPFSASALESQIASARDSLTKAFQDLAGSLQSFDPADLSAYAAVEARLQTVHDALDAAFDAVESLYGVLTAAVASSQWDAIFAGYVSVLGAVHLEEVPTIDDAIDAMAGTLESLISRLTMTLSAEDLAKQVARVSASIHEAFARSPLGQVRQILIDFIEKVRAALEKIPAGEVRQAVEGMLERVGKELDDLRIDQVSGAIEHGFQSARDYVDHNLGNDLLAGLHDTLTTALGQFKNIPFADLANALNAVVQDAGKVIQDLESSISSGLDQIKELLATLDSVDFRPVSNAVIEEIDQLKAKLSDIKPESLSEVEKVAIQAALSLLKAIDLDGMIEKELKKEFNDLDGKLCQEINKLLQAWLDFRGRIGSLDGSALIAPITGLLDRVGTAVQGLNGGLAVKPLQELSEGLADQLRGLSPQAILDPLREPYQRMMQTIQRANPDVWVAPLRELNSEINRLVNLVDIRPLLDLLERKEKELFAQARQAVASSLDAVHLPAPLDTFFNQMKTLVQGLTDAVFADPDVTLRSYSSSVLQSVRPSTVFQPLDLAFDKLLSALDALPQDQLLAALESIRTGIGTALPALDPTNVLGAMRAAQGRIAALSPASLAGVVALPGLRVSLAARLALSTENGAAKAQLLARFDLVLAPLAASDADSRISRLTKSHRALVSALQQRIDALEASGAQAAFQRLDAGLRRILPEFLTQNAPLDMAAVHAGLDTLRPSNKAHRIDLTVDRFLAQLAPLLASLDDAIDGFFQEIRQAALLLHPAGLKDAVTDVYDTLRHKLNVIDPDQLAASLRASVWEPLMAPLQAIDPASLKAKLHALFEELLNKVTGAIDGLLDQVKEAIDGFLKQIRDALSSIVAGLKEQTGKVLEGVSALMAEIDKLVVDDLFKRLLNLLGNLKTSFSEELDRVRNEFDAMLNAIPLGASASVAIA